MVLGTFYDRKNIYSIGNYLDFSLGNFGRDHSYITSSQFWGFWTPLPPYVSMFLVLRISKNWHFLTPPPPYKCWRNIWMIPKQLFQVASTENRTTKPWITKPMLYLYIMGDPLEIIIKECILKMYISWNKTEMACSAYLPPVSWLVAIWSTL